MLDARINRHGYMIGQRSDHEWAAREARHHIENARFYRAMARDPWRRPGEVAELRGQARFHLREAARWRRSFADRITPEA
jgi:hypothetical protein